MKKLLSILAAIGMTATAASSVVACGSHKKADDNKKPDDNGGDKPTPTPDPQPAVPQPKPVKAKQSFAEAKAPATFKVEPTSEELAKDFAVKDKDGNPIEGVTYKFVPNQNTNTKFVSFASGISGFVVIKVPVKAPTDGGSTDNQPAPVIKVETTDAGKKNVSGFNPDAISVSKPFEVNGMNLSGELVDTFSNGKDSGVKTATYINKDTIIEAISNNVDLKKAVTSALFDGKDDDFTKGINNIDYKVATGMDIDEDNVKKDFDSSNGTLLPKYFVIPNGTAYQLGLTVNNRFFWLNLGFNKNTTGYQAAESEISNIKFIGGRELTADISNMTKYGDMKSLAPVFANLRFEITKGNGNKVVVPYTVWSAYGINLPADEYTTNDSQGISRLSAIKDGKLDLKWGQNYSINDGDTVKLSYTDFTGTIRTATKTADPNNFEAKTVTLDSSVVKNLVNPDGTAHSLSFINRDKVLDAVKNSKELSAEVSKVFGNDYSNLNYEVAKGMSIYSGNVNKAFDINAKNGTQVLKRMAIPNGTTYQIGLHDNSGKYYWFNAKFDKTVKTSAKKSAVSNIRFVGGRELTADLSNMVYGDMNTISAETVNLELIINGQKVPYTYDSSYSDKANPDFGNRSNGLSWRSRITNGKLDLIWGPWWNLVNGQQVTFNYTDFAGNRISTTKIIDFSNTEADEITLSGELLDNEPFKDQGVNSKSYINKNAILEQIEDDELTSRDVYTSLFGWDTKGKSFAEALKDKSDELTYDLAKDMKIDFNNAYRAFDKDAKNGIELPNRLAIPDGGKYQIGLHTNDGKYFWLNMSYIEKVVDRISLKQSTISNIRFVGGRELTADISNMNYGGMNSVAPIFADFSLSVNGNRIPYTDWSRYGDNNMQDSWNHGDGISWRPTFKNGKLDLIWGKWWNLNNGDKIHIEYKDFTGNTVKSDSIVDFSNPELNTITLSGDLLDNKYTDGKQDVDRKSYINTAAIIDKVSQNEAEARNVYSALFGWDTEGKTSADALKAKENEISFDVTKDMKIDYTNAFEAYDGKLLASRLAIPDGSKYQIGLKTKSGAYFWINMSFAKTISQTAKESQINDIKLGDANINHGRSLDMDVTNMSYGDMNDVTPVFADLEFKINGERIPYTTWSTIGDQTNPDWNIWNTGNGIGVMSRFQNGKLHLEWGPGRNNSWYLRSGSTFQISYTDFTGHRVDTGELKVNENGVLVGKPTLKTNQNGKTTVSTRVYGLAKGYVPAWDSMKFLDADNGNKYLWESKEPNQLSWDSDNKVISFTYGEPLQKGKSYAIMFKAMLPSDKDSHGTNTWYHSLTVKY